ncbi:unnamed protein product [Brassica rapa subsp. trilocularis]
MPFPFQVMPKNYARALTKSLSTLNVDCCKEAEIMYFIQAKFAQGKFKDGEFAHFLRQMANVNYNS